MCAITCYVVLCYVTLCCVVLCGCAWRMEREAYSGYTYAMNLCFSDVQVLVVVCAIVSLLSISLY